MSAEQINIRLDAELVSALERVAREESLDRATVIRRLLETSVRHWDLEHAIVGYRRGELSLGRSAEESGLTQWELIDAIRAAGLAYPLDAAEVRGRLDAISGAETAETLPDFPPRGGSVLLVGVNPAPVSVAAGHYYQGRVGRRLWRRLDRIGLLGEATPGAEDEAFVRAGHGLTNLVKRSTKSAAELTDEELDAGVETLREKLRAWRPALILFPFREPALRLLGRNVSVGPCGEVEGIPAFLLSGPYAARDESVRVDAELRAQLGLGAEATGNSERTQRVTAADLTAGRIRLPRPAKRFFPSRRGDVEVVLRGARLALAYDPRMGTDRERSAVLSVPRERLGTLVEPNERLTVTRGLGGVVRLD